VGTAQHPVAGIDTASNLSSTLSPVITQPSPTRVPAFTCACRRTGCGRVSTRHRPAWVQGWSAARRKP